jgi:hypothetical protein
MYMRRISVILLCGLLLAACTSNTHKPNIATAATASAAAASSSQRPGGAADQAAVQQFVACMRQHGVTIKDDQQLAPPHRDTPQRAPWDRGVAACEHLLPGGTLNPGPSPEDMEKLRAFAVCMRAHDIPITDPLPDGNMKINGRFENITRTQVEADPVYKAAITACQDKLPSDSKSPESHS